MVLEYVWLVPALPFAAFLLILLLRDRIPGGGAAIAIPAVFASFLISGGIFLRVWGSGATYETSVRWMQIGQHEFRMGFLVDDLSAIMAVLVSLLSGLIVLYSVGYMADQGKRLPRYYAEITLFISGMLGTVLADNYLLMFMSWEIMGLCSYLLIGYWFEKPSAASASKKAFMVTRIGDISLLLGLLVLFRVFGSFSYRAIFDHPEIIEANAGLVTLGGLLIFGGAVGKSAQFPLHVWLPDAMEGPTTVSALIHAATMVKAGVFLVARSFPLYEHVPDVFLWIGLLGGVTAFIAATMALVQWDIKRVLAYSTLSQLGYMFLALGAGGFLLHAHHDTIGYTAGLYHLMNHAFFKALLFLAAGSVILGVHHHNDMRKMGGLHRKMPVTSTTMLIGSLAIAGVPPLSGFWSKDEVLAATREAGAESALFSLLWILALATAFLTAFYMFRMWYLTFAGSPRSEYAENAHESPRVMTVPLMILAGFAILSGFFLFQPAFGEMMAAPGTHAHAGLFVSILTNPWTWVGFAVAATGLWLATRAYLQKKTDPAKWVEDAPGKQIHGLLSNLYYYDTAFMRTGQAVGMGLARVSRRFDDNVVDGTVRGVGALTVATGRRSARWQTGRITTYAAAMITGVTLVLFFVVYASAWMGGGA